MCTAAAACQTNFSAFEEPVVAAAPKNETLSAGPYPYVYEDLTPQYRPDSQGEEAGLWMTVAKVEAQVKTAGNRIVDPELNAYLRDVTCRVAGPYCPDLRIYAMQMPGFNASMYPNGMLHIWSGLLLRVQNEAQLAGVIGHEMAHYLRRHSLQRMRDIIEKTNALMFFSMALAAAGIPVVGDIATLATYGSMAAFSRDHEREADGYGLLLVGRAGYNPQEIWKVWQRVMREREADEDDDNSMTLMASHPPSEERLDALRRLASRVPVAGVAETGRDRFQNIILPRRARFIRDELHLRKFDRLEALLDGLIEDGHGIAELHYFKGELYRLRNKKGDQEKAIQAYAAAQRTGQHPAEMYRSLGLVFRSMDQPAKAVESFRRYLDLAPGAPDAGIVGQLLREAET